MLDSLSAAFQSSWMNFTFNLVAFSTYLGTTALIVQNFDKLAEHTKRWRTIQFLWLFALLTHATPLLLDFMAGQLWEPTALKANSVIALIVAGTLFFSCLRQPLEVMAVFFLPLAALSIVLALFDASSMPVTQPPAGIKAHIIFSLLAYSILLLSAGLAIVLHLQDRCVHQATTSWLSTKLPALEKTEIFLLHLLIVGFVLLTLGLISGWIYVENLFAQHLTHKTALSMLAWFVFGALLWGRAWFGWRGSQFTYWLLIATGLLILAFLGSKIILGLIDR